MAFQVNDASSSLVGSITFRPRRGGYSVADMMLSERGAMAVQATLLAAADYIERGKSDKYMALDHRGIFISPYADTATQFSLLGALSRAAYYVLDGKPTIDEPESIAELNALADAALYWLWRSRLLSHLRASPGAAIKWAEHRSGVEIALTLRLAAADAAKIHAGGEF